MNPQNTAPWWLPRLLRLAAVLNVGAAIALWVTPLNVPGRNLVPVGCGSPAAPLTGELTDFICHDHISGLKLLAVALAVSAGLLLAISEIVVARLGGHGWVRGFAIAAVVAVPLFAVSTSSLFTTIARSSADGSLIRCGTPLAPATDSLSKLVCGQLPEASRSLALSGMALSALALLGGGYVAARPRDEEDGEAGPGATDGNGSNGAAQTPDEPTPPTSDWRSDPGERATTYPEARYEAYGQSSGPWAQGGAGVDRS